MADTARIETHDSASQADSEQKKLKPILKSQKQQTGPILDKEGNILPYADYQVEYLQSKWCKPSPIARLAEAASLSKPVPTAGDYAIDHCKEPMPPNSEIPPECFLYDEDRPFVLGKLNKKCLDYPEPAEPVPLPKSVLEYLDALEAAEIARINRSRAGQAEVSKDETVPAIQKQTKSRNTSMSPARGLRKSSRSSTPTGSSPRPGYTPKNNQERPKTPKSPGRGDAPAKKLASSPRPAAKKIVNAK